MGIVKAKKYLGQHFLKDQNIARKITDSLLPLTANVLEIGPGMGVLTQYLLKNNRFSVLAIDIDRRVHKLPPRGLSATEKTDHLR